MRALVFGGTGMLGRAVAAEWRRRGQAVLALSRAQADLLDADRLVEWAEGFRPLVIINCGAFTQVDACETEWETAKAANGSAVGNVVEAARRIGARMIHISSDYVFSGNGTEPYPTDALTGPVSAYGKSKLLGEEEASQYERSLVLRTSWLFGPGGPNFVATMRRLMLAGTELKVVDDQVGGPTYTPYLARAIADLAEREASGVFHYQNRDAVSWYGFAREIARCLRVSQEIRPVTTEEFPRPAPRPAYSVLDVSGFEEMVDRRVEPWICGLCEYLETLGGNYP